MGVRAIIFQVASIPIIVHQADIWVQITIVITAALTCIVVVGTQRICADNARQGAAKTQPVPPPPTSSASTALQVPAIQQQPTRRPALPAKPVP